MEDRLIIQSKQFICGYHKYLFVGFVVLLMSSCHLTNYIEPTRLYMIPKEPIDIVITDLMRTSKYKGVDYDAIELVAEDYGKFISIVVCPKKRLDSRNKYMLSDLERNLNRCSIWLPSEYVERGNKIFYWVNEEVPITQETINALVKHNQVMHEDYMIATTDGEVLVYYMCKSNYKHYRKQYEDFYKRPPCMCCK